MVLGDGEGGIEMTGSMQLIREFCDYLIIPEKIVKTRIVSHVQFMIFFNYPLDILAMYEIHRIGNSSSQKQKKLIMQKKCYLKVYLSS